MSKNNFIRTIDKTKIKKDLIWNYISLFFLGLSGIGINICIGINFEPSILGAFNQVLVTYLLASILASGGINYSVLTALAQNKLKKNISIIIKGALIPGIVLSILIIFIYSSLTDFISSLFGSEDVRIGMITITPAIFFFSINKIILLGIINGLGRMRGFAIYQIIRYLGLIISLLIVINQSINGPNLTIIFLISEFFLFIILIIDITYNYHWWRAENWFHWTRKHLFFGFKSLLSSLFIEMNTRIDIFMLGIFLSDEVVGIYSFAALFAEGFLQIIVVLQNNINPILAKLIKTNKVELSKFISKLKWTSYKFISLIGILSISIYPLLISLITNKPEFIKSFIPFSIILLGIIISSGYLPFQNILIMFNRPSEQSNVIILVALINVCLNSIFIPLLGMKGASLGTALSTIFSVYILKYFVKKEFNLKI
tara:strand:+ start:1947 stop:3230 length:1284 start_codon:yes stop_codon:yes gene_type:complete